MPLKVRVRNFQSIEDATLVIDGLTVVTGTNNAGKSAFSTLLFDAMFAAEESLQKVLHKQVKPYMASKSSVENADDDPADAPELFGEDPFQNDQELADILAGISGEAPVK